MNLRYWWWKILCVMMFLYVFTFGLLTPLKPGIEEIHPDRIQAGQALELRIKSYNTHFTQSDNMVYLKNSEGYYIYSNNIKVLDDNELIANINVPAFIPSKQNLESFSVIVSSEKDGTSIIPSKLIIKQDSINEIEAHNSWHSDKPSFSILNEFRFPYRNILYETIRNTFFHVSLWFAMFALLMASVYNSIFYLIKNEINYDLRSFAQVRTAILFGTLGLLTGSLWAKYTWGSWWTNDIKLNMAALSMLIYFGYLILRAGIDDYDRRARISSAFNVFALVAIIPLIFVLPRIMDSLHPGNGGNPAFGSEDMDNTLRKVFYPAVFSFILLGIWLSSLVYRLDKIIIKNEAEQNN